MERLCGDCHQCCITVAVRELKKPAGVPCQHLDILDNDPCYGGGCCGIYDRRPLECAQYSCAWLDGFLGDDMRPNASGLLFEKAWIEWPAKLTILMGFEVAEGSLDRHADALDAAAVGGVVIGVVPFDRVSDPSYFGEADALLALATWMRAVQRRGSITHQFADQTVEQRLPE